MVDEASTVANGEPVAAQRCLMLVTPPVHDGPMTILVVCQVPVYVEVDTTRGRVVSVTVDDEAVSQPVDVLGVGNDDDRRRALELVEEGTWPAWRFGN